MNPHHSFQGENVKWKKYETKIDQKSSGEEIDDFFFQILGRHYNLARQWQQFSTLAIHCFSFNFVVNKKRNTNSNINMLAYKWALVQIIMLHGIRYLLKHETIVSLNKIRQIEG